jgi:hypothetical protein
MRVLDVRPAGDDMSRIDFPLAGLAIGEYLIEVTAKGRSGEAKELIDFRITN